MSEYIMLIKRNVKLFFKDKGLFFTALITPMILLVLYATFLKGVYENAFLAMIPDGIEVSKDVMNGLVGGQLVSSLLSVSCVTVAFCSNFLMVQDRANGVIRDLKMTPVTPAKLAVGYYGATLFATLIICYTATVISLLYLAAVGFYLSAVDAALLFLDVTLLSLFGVALSSVVNFFLTTQGQISAVGSVISSSYGFICGAYMPISSFGTFLQRAVTFLPGTYGTSLLRTHAMRGTLEKMHSDGLPSELTEALADSVDMNLYFFGSRVEEYAMYIILIGAVTLLVGAYVALNIFKSRSESK